jgi:hypothetical protein
MPARPEKCCGKKMMFDADEGQPEMDLRERLRVIVAEHLREPVVPAAEDAEGRAERHRVVEVRDDVVGVVQRAVDAGVRQDTTPVTPPTVNRKMKPIAQSIGVAKRIEPPHMVAIQEKILMPVGTAITMVAAMK